MANKPTSRVETSLFTDAVSASRTVDRQTVDTASFTDSVTAAETSDRSQVDTASFTDFATAIKTGSSPVVDTASFTDIITHTKSQDRTLLETIYFHDTVVAQMLHGEIQDYQFVIDIVPRIPFGPGLDISTGTFDPGSFTLRPQDADSPVGDYRQFGTDKRTPPIWGWTLFTDKADPAEALGWADNLAAVWNDAVRETPEGVLSLRYRVAGRIRRVYGRPGNFTPVPDQVNIGKVHITCDFRLSEDTYYEDTETTVDVSLMPALSTVRSGIVLPQPLPWRFTTQPPPRTGIAYIGGTKKTWVDVTFYGPSYNPYVTIGSQTWGIRGTIGLGNSITLSGKPWDMKVQRQTGLYAPEMLDPRARLSQLSIKPGTYSVIYGAVDGTGTSHATLRWRNAYQTL